MSGIRRKVILDACVPVDFRHHLQNCDVVTARFAVLQDLKNGQLLEAIEGRFNILVTVDSNMTKQQNMLGRQLAIVVVRARTNRLIDLLPGAKLVEIAIAASQPGEVREIVV
jgi:predicted nuclease of predicted toxin-antitoxin system